MWAFEMIPPDWQSKGNDLIWLAAFVGAVVVLVSTFWRMKWIRRTVLWFWRRTWGRDEHGIYLTPTVRRDRRTQAAVEPLLDKQSMALAAEFLRARQEQAISLQEFRTENASSHTKAEVALEGLAGRVAALESTANDLGARLGKVESVLMNGEVRSP